jgi:hypothetical protein
MYISCGAASSRASESSRSLPGELLLHGSKDPGNGSAKSVSEKLPSFAIKTAGIDSLALACIIELAKMNGRSNAGSGLDFTSVDRVFNVGSTAVLNHTPTERVPETRPTVIIDIRINVYSRMSARWLDDGSF